MWDFSECVIVIVIGTGIRVPRRIARHTQSRFFASERLRKERPATLFNALPHDVVSRTDRGFPFCGIVFLATRG